ILHGNHDARQEIQREHEHSDEFSGLWQAGDEHRKDHADAHAEHPDSYPDMQHHQGVVWEHVVTHQREQENHESDDDSTQCAFQTAAGEHRIHRLDLAVGKQAAVGGYGLHAPVHLVAEHDEGGDTHYQPGNKFSARYNSNPADQRAHPYQQKYMSN